MPTRHVTARRDPALSARVVRRLPMTYAEGADPSVDRPAHVRAASGLAWVGDRLAVIQDDAAFLALVDPATGLASALPLPAGKGGVRLFDDARGNKAQKADHEALVTIAGDDAPLLLALGSGSTDRREQAALFTGLARGTPDVHIVHLPRLYAVLREARDFSGSELNIEGGVHAGPALRLFARGNGAPRDGRAPLDATCDLDWAAFRAHLDAPDRAPVPAVREIVQYELGALSDARLGFTDAVADADGAILYLAAAEDSPDATRDGAVAGSAIGRIVERDGALEARWTELCDADGALLALKAEGLVAGREPGQLWVVVDHDAHDRASELCEVRLGGEWGVR